MALPLAIFADAPFPISYWQEEQAAELIKNAQKDLKKQRYLECRANCDEALSYQCIRVKDEITAYLLLAWSVDEHTEVKSARRKAQALFEEHYIHHLFDAADDPATCYWIRDTKALLGKLEAYERTIGSQHEARLKQLDEDMQRQRQSPTYKARVFDPLPAGSKKKVVVIDGGTSRSKAGLIPDVELEVEASQEFSDWRRILDVLR